jgi:hypothetical protein
VDYEIRPEPSEAERAALEAALRAGDDGAPRASLSRWWRDGIEPAEADGYEATARPRSKLGATRA